MVKAQRKQVKKISEIMKELLRTETLFEQLVCDDLGMYSFK